MVLAHGAPGQPIHVGMFFMVRTLAKILRPVREYVSYDMITNGGSTEPSFYGCLRGAWHVRWLSRERTPSCSRFVLLGSPPPLLEIILDNIAAFPMVGGPRKIPSLIKLAVSSFWIGIRLGGVALLASDPDDTGSHSPAACLPRGGCFLCGGTLTCTDTSPTRKHLHNYIFTCLFSSSPTQVSPPCAA